jgi:hypothetical protein
MYDDINFKLRQRPSQRSEIESSIRSMWGFDCFFSSFSSNSRGVSILFNSNFEYEVLKKNKTLTIHIHQANKNRTIVNVNEFYKIFF